LWNLLHIAFSLCETYTVIFLLWDWFCPWFSLHADFWLWKFLRADFCSLNSLHVDFSLCKICTLIFLLIKQILFMELVACRFLLGKFVACYFCPWNFLHIDSSLRESSFMFLKLVHWFFSSCNWFCSWKLLRADFCSCILHYPDLSSWSLLHVYFLFVNFVQRFFILVELIIQGI